MANSPRTTAGGTMSAGRIYDELPGECAAVVRFMTQTKVIARVLPDKKLNIKIDVTLEDQNNTDIFSQVAVDSITEPVQSQS